MTKSNLFKPIKIGSLDLSHRLVMAPLTRFRSPNHIPSELQRIYYEQRSRTPGTFIITEATFISPKAGGLDNVPGIWNKDQINGWSKIIKDIHKNGSKVFMQLWALGREATPEVLEREGLPYVSSSANLIGYGGFEAGDKPRPLPKALTIPEIEEYIDDYVKAAKNAIEAGADGVEIHMANGYLLEQFIWEGCNHRTDKYGGSIENRVRFPLQVLDSVVEAIGADKVGVRFSPWRFYTNNDGTTPIPTWSYLTEQIEKRAVAGKRIAYIHLIEPRGVLSSRPWMKYNEKGDNTIFNLLWSGPIINAGGYDLEKARKDADKYDRWLIAVGRYFISTPDLVARWERGLPPNDYDRPTFYVGGEKGYIDYPFAEELESDKK